MLSAVFLPQQSLSLVGPQSTQSKQFIRHDVDSMLHVGLQCWQPGITLMMDWLVQVLHVPMLLHSVQWITHFMGRRQTWQSQTYIEHNSPCQVSVSSSLGVLQVIVPITVLAVYHAFAYGAKNFPNNASWRRYGVPAHSFLAAHQVHHALLHKYALWMLHRKL